jgi:hypothetical protein
MLESPLILYIETNFLISIATGRDPDAHRLLASPLPSLDLVLPQVCYMEAFSVLNNIHRQRNQFRNSLHQQISELGRDRTSENAKNLLLSLEQASIAHEKLDEDIDTRLFDAVQLASRNSNTIGLTAEILDDHRNAVFIDDPTDNLILHCMLAHAKTHLTDRKVFLSGNRNDFGSLAVQNEFQRAGVNKSFWRAKQFLDWFTSQAHSDDPLS